MRAPSAWTGPALRRQLRTAIHPQRRAYKVAVLGGGITGLTAAWRLSNDPNCTGVTLYEKSAQLGGWLQSESIPVDGGNVLFEYGPRTIRSTYPAAVPTALMACSLGLANDFILTSKDSPAARNRFIYYPDRLVRLPSPQKNLSAWQNVTQMFKTVTEEPLFDKTVSGMINEFISPPRPPWEYEEDESIRSFISRRFNYTIADNLVSAMMHGIYAGDIEKLSAQTLLGNMRNMETDGIIRTLFRNMRTGARNMVVDDFLGQAALPRGDRYQSVVHNATKRSSTFTFTGGLQQLSDALAENLTTSPKVRIETNCEVSGLTQSEMSDDIRISSKNSSKKETFDRVIASIPAPALADILDKKKSPPGQKPAPVDTVNLLKMNNYATTVMVVNLYYSDPDLLRQEGFGYLIPRSIPFEENPDCALGVIFASASSKGTRPDLVTEATQDTAPGTKLTIMFGGHYWDGWSRRDYPDHDSAVRMARRTLQRHLGIMQAPKLARSRLQVDAIPQYTVGHLKNTFALSARVMRDFNRKLTLAGNWYNGVGVNDCVRQGLVAATFCVGNQGPGFQDKTPSVGWNPDVEFPVAEWNVPPEGGVAIAPSRYVTVTPRKGFPALGKSPTDSTKTTRN